MKCTKQNEERSYSLIDDSTSGEMLAFEKLCRLERIEEDLGVGLLKLFDCLKNGAFFIDVNGEIKHAKPDLKMRFDGKDMPYLMFWSEESGGKIAFLKDQGKTWSMHKDDLK